MNIIEYVEKNGIFDFNERPFCEVDSLIISQLVYLKFERIISSPGQGKTGIKLSDIRGSKYYDTIYRDERYREVNTLFYNALADSKRFGSLILNNFVDVIDKTIDVQFCAMTVEDGKGFTYVVFRGTDDSFIGWKEDLNMTFKIPVPAQRYSVDYLNKVAKMLNGSFYVGGHSKGGNLAVYSSMYCEEEAYNRIINIFSHDGPGFRGELLNETGLKRIHSKIKKYVPKAAVVGLFGNVERFEVVDCEKHGVKQHNPYNWIVEGFSFKKTEHIGKYSALKADAINSWASEMTPENWALLSDQIFGLFDEAGITNLNDFNDDFIGTVNKIRLASDKMDEESKNRIKGIFSMFKDSATNVAIVDARERAQDAKEKALEAKEKVMNAIPNKKDNN